MDVKHELTIQKRRCLIIWLYSLRQLKQLKRYGIIHYVSHRAKYVVLYTEDEGIDIIKNKISELNFVKTVEKSYLPDLNMSFTGKIDNKTDTSKIENSFDLEKRTTKIQLSEQLDDYI